MQITVITGLLDRSNSVHCGTVTRIHHTRKEEERKKWCEKIQWKKAREGDLHDPREEKRALATSSRSKQRLAATKMACCRPGPRVRYNRNWWEIKTLTGGLMHAACTYTRSFGARVQSLEGRRPEGMESCTCRPFAENPAGEEGLVGERTSQLPKV